MLGDHVAEHVDGSAVDSDQRRPSVQVLGAAVRDRAARVCRNGCGGPEHIHQLRGDVTHGLRDRDPPEDSGCALGGLDPGERAPESVRHPSIVEPPSSSGVDLCCFSRDRVCNLGHRRTEAAHDRDVGEPVPVGATDPVLGR